MNKNLSIRLAIALMVICLQLLPISASAQEEKGKETATAEQKGKETATMEQKPMAAYRIEFNVREIENGKRLNSRNYMIMAKDNDWSRIRVQDNVPYQASDNSYQHTDLRMDIDCRPHERSDNVALDISVNFSSMAPAPDSAPRTPPVFRTANTGISAVVTLGKPTLVASSDDVSSNRRYEIEVTATKVK
jgi:hypothetical protein